MLSLGPQDVAAHLAFLYLEANAGASSGGHVALQINETLYHYENNQQRLILVREDWESFRHRYTDLDNRTLHKAELSVSEPDLRVLERHLTRLFNAQRQRLETLTNLEQTVALLSAIAEEKAPEIAGADFTRPKISGPSPGLKPPSPAIDSAALRAEAETLRRQRQELTHAAKGGVTLPPPSDLSAQWVALFQRERALRILLGEYALNSKWILDAGPWTRWQTSPASDCAPARWLQQYAELKKEWIRHRLDHPVTGMEFPFLLALAQLEVTEQALREQRLLLLVPAKRLMQAPKEDEAFKLEPQILLEERALDRFETVASQTFCQGEAHDGAWLNLAIAADEWLETRNAHTQKRPVAFRPDPDVPGGIGPLLEPTISPRPIDIQALESASERAAAYGESLNRDAGYDLITRNCVTALIEAINGAFSHADESQALGGHISPSSSQSFVPYRFFELVKSRYRLESVSTLASSRHRLSLRSDPEGGWSELLEASPLTGRAYRPRLEDGTFLVFTEQAPPWIRPLGGAINLSYGLLATTLGLFRAPWDEGRLIIAGGHGILFSLPELAGWNIRKGTYTETTLMEARVRVETTKFSRAADD